MQQTTQLPTETQAPATLDGVSIQDCQFTESASSPDPRPPLFSGRRISRDDFGLISDSVFLAVEGGKVLVRLACDAKLVNGQPAQVGRVYGHPPGGPRYTGPITPAMWVWIRKYWKP